MVQPPVIYGDFAFESYTRRAAGMHATTLVSFVVFVFIACVGSWLVGINLNNSYIFHFVQRASIRELSFDAEFEKDITSSLPDIFPYKFNCTWIELQRRVRSFKQFYEAFSTSQASFQAKNSFPVHETNL